MKWLLVIPSLMLFLSNVSFTVEMKMPEKSGMAISEGCHRNGSCTGEMPDNCPMQSMVLQGGEPMCAMKVKNGPCKQDGPSSKPCKNSEPTCICILCFQYSAPAPILEDFQLAIADLSSNYTGFLSLKWKDPHLAAPWQPPDLV